VTDQEDIQKLKKHCGKLDNLLMQITRERRFVMKPLSSVSVSRISNTYELIMIISPPDEDLLSIHINSLCDKNGKIHKVLGEHH
jgi:hypothetical protein